MSEAECYEWRPRQTGRSTACYDKEIAILRAQRLNLLTALRGVVDIIDHGGPHALAPGHICGPDAFCDQDCAGVSYEQETLADARAAIANARGGA